MLKRCLNPANYAAAIVFLAAGLFAACFAYSSYNLFHLSMANLSFLRRYGWLAVMEGGLLQLIQILGWGCISLLCFIAFKICESELTLRFRRWHDR